MGNDLLSGFNGRHTSVLRLRLSHRVAASNGACGSQSAQEFVQQRNGREFAVLFAIVPDHAPSQGLYMTMHMHQTDFPSEGLDDFHAPGDGLFAIASIHHGKDQSIEVRLRGFSEHRITDVPKQFGARGVPRGKMASTRLTVRWLWKTLNPVSLAISLAMVNLPTAGGPYSRISFMMPRPTECRCSLTDITLNLRFSYSRF